MISKRLLFDIDNKVIVITGATGVLGSAMSDYLAMEGAKVVLLGRKRKVGEKLQHQIRKKGGEAIFLETEVLNRARLEENRNAILSQYKKIDVLINAAGGNTPGASIKPEETFLDLNLENMQEVMDLNLMGTVLPTQVFLQGMINHGKGNIINISSETALRPLSRVIAYSAAKAAVSNFTKFMATELAQKYGEQFRINALAPGFFISEQNRNLLCNEDGSYTDRAKSILAHTPFQRFGMADELLGTIHYLVSDASRFVTGAVLVVDGGFDVFSI